MMYKDFEAETSYRYLKEVIGSLQEPVCILGGWAVFFHVNDRFQRAQGRPYLGSRDIDLGFHIDRRLEKSTLAQAIDTLTNKLKFQPLSFRLVKEIHTETKEELRKGQMVPAHFIFPMYVDLIVDTIPKDFRRIFGFDPIDEPLLKSVFNGDASVILNEFGRNVLLPKPELLLAMKFCSLPGRDKEHKRLKDLCDIFALSWYADINSVKLVRHISRHELREAHRIMEEVDYARAGALIGHSGGEIRRVIETIVSA
jgi:hypothetical protein